MTVRKRTGRAGWEFIFDLDRGPDGKRRQLRRSGFRTRKEAETAERIARAEVDGGVIFEKDEPTLAEYVLRWLDVKQTTLERSTWLRYEQLLRLHILPQLGRTQLKKLRPLAIQATYAKIQQNGLTARTAEQAHAVLRSALQQAVKWQLVNRNPCEAVEKPHPAKPTVRVPTIHEARLLLAKGDETRFGRIYRIAALTGCREGELLALRWQEVDFEHALLRIVRSARHFKGEGVVIKDTKTHRWRAVALSSTAVRLLEEQRGAQLLEMMAEELDYEHAGLVFANPLGRPLNADTVRSVWRRDVCAQLGLQGIHLHALRHAHASAMMGAGVNPKVITERLGHQSTAFTMDVYGHLGPTLQAEAAEEYDRLLRGN